jgi:predicted AAA+ superfamily ATPase
MLLNDSNTLGIIFENLVIKELKLFCQMNGAEIYYFRDSSGYEVDAIIELNDGNDGWIAIEIKLGSDIGIQEGIKNLKNLKNKIKFEKMEKLKSMNIITGGSKSYTTEDGINVASIFHLHF